MSPRQTTAISLTKRLFLLVIVGTASVFLIKGIYSLGLAQSSEAPAQERKLKVTELKDMPLEVKVKNLQSKTWHKDLEIEVKNISGRPIYYILAHLQFPDDPPPQPNSVWGISLHYGKRENIMISHLADPDDEHLDPEKSYVFKFPEELRAGFEKRHKENPGVDKNVVLEVALVSFGDRTGWELGQPRDKRNISAASDQPKKKRHQIDWIRLVVEPQTRGTKISGNIWHTHLPPRNSNAVAAMVVHHG
jgi:hypothetical protein